MNRFIASFLLMGFLAACGQESGEAPSPANTRVVARPAFDGQAALALVRTQVEFGPRVPGREGHLRQLEWMTELLNQWADTVATQSLEHVTGGGETLALTNVLARFNPAAEHRILLLSHWDTRPWSDQSLDPAEREVPVPGANDGASGTAILLHLAQLMAQDPPPTGVDLLFVDGEDYGPGTEDMFIGSRHFARNLPTPLPWAYGLLLDMVGDQDPRFPVEANSAEAAPRIVQRVWGVAQDLGYGAYFPIRVGSRIMDDHVMLNEAGLPTVDIIDFEYGPENRLWHTPRDTPENVSSRTLVMVGDVVTELVYRGG
ncbi:MAG: M28 family peptidase [Gemmatimonadales bacterium]|nr:MAG: M28 family peptidase [Gemmatimonadales bacterium]